MHLYSEPNAPNAFWCLDFSRAQAPRAPWVTPAARGAGRRPLPYSGWIATPCGTARSGHKPAEDEEALPSICRHAPGPRMIPAPEPLPVPEPRPSPKPHGSGRVHAFPSAALSWLTRTRAPSSRSSSPQPQAQGAGSTLCGMLRRAVGAGRPLYRLLRHVARTAAAKNREVGGEWYPAPRCAAAATCASAQLQTAALGSLKLSKSCPCPFQPHANVVDKLELPIQNKQSGY